MSVADGRFDDLCRDLVGWPVQPTPSTADEQIEDIRLMLADRARSRIFSAEAAAPGKADLARRLAAHLRARP